MEPVEQYLTIAEASRLLGKDRHTIKGWMQRGTLAYWINPGGKWVTTREAIEQAFRPGEPPAKIQSAAAMSRRHKKAMEAFYARRGMKVPES